MATYSHLIIPTYLHTEISYNLYGIRINKQLLNTYINLNIQYITMNYIYKSYIVGYLLNLPDNVFI